MLLTPFNIVFRVNILKLPRFFLPILISDLCILFTDVIFRHPEVNKILYTTLFLMATHSNNSWQTNWIRVALILNSSLSLLYAYLFIAGDIKSLLKAKFKSLIREQNRSKTSLWSFQSKNGMLKCCDNRFTIRTSSEPVVLFMWQALIESIQFRTAQCGECGCTTVITLH